MGPINGVNLAEVPYFSLQEYVDRIDLDDDVLAHIEETNKCFADYLKQLSKYDNYAILYYWLDSLKKEMFFSSAIENHDIGSNLLFDDDLFFDSFNINHSRIKKIHQYATNGEIISEYRNNDVRVSTITNGEEQIFWRGANPEDIRRFMNDFITIYKRRNISILSYNPFIKSALMHLLFVRIHPFIDGNGRTARMIHNLKFTQSINDIYRANLRVCPLNLSQSILLNKQTYVNRLNSIYFDLEHDSNDEINRWFDFVLNMADEQIHYHLGKLPELSLAFEHIKEISKDDDSYYAQYARKMKIKNL